MVIKLLREHQFYAKLRKCSFYQGRMHYLGHIILEDGIKTEIKKIKSIEEWTIPRKVS
jgi:hypothetical protein